ncbi:DUF692 domain-containing protein [Acuticoccus sp. M5D2P5]|uniref:MNIO family bufferin maturase n=1 Tax=Acuticoccus kalidii TaxID=2910977 RepID=UPI001F31476C|nr:DUF692 domain-containing protein [Acuticoccus kalidii]MCF3935802.1 DUF692 domain-containing protein [Acuticoccus kalidii]
MAAPTRTDGTIPARAGVGFKLAHTEALLAAPDRVGFVEIHAENYMGAGGPPHHALSKVREVLPVSLHGVGLSIGGEAPLDGDHLARLAAVAARYEPGLVSEHLAWSTHAGAYFNDLLPLPYTEATLARVADHVDAVQAALGRTILLENPSSYVAFAASTMSETDFIRAVAARTGCGLLLDINNVFVSATNLGLSAEDYLAAFPVEAVGEVHLAGHLEEVDARGEPLLIDTHDRPIANPVWSLYLALLRRLGRPTPTLIEWDTDVPAFETLAREAETAERLMREVDANANGHADANGRADAA